MSGLTPAGEGGKYLNITAGRIRRTVEKDTPGAKMREWETKDGKKGVKYELVYSNIAGLITNVRFHDGEFGEQLLVTIKAGEEFFTLTMPSDSRYALNFMRRIPGVNFHHEAILTPYDVEDGGKRNTGIKIAQDGETIGDFFWDKDKKENKHGIPQMNVDMPDSDDWKMHFMQVKKFLKKFVNESITPQLQGMIGQPKASTQPGGDGAEWNPGEPPPDEMPIGFHAEKDTPF